MPNPNDPALMAQKKVLGKEIDALKVELAADSTNEALQALLKTKEAAMRSLHDQLKAGRIATRATRKSP